MSTIERTVRALLFAGRGWLLGGLAAVAASCGPEGGQVLPPVAPTTTAPAPSVAPGMCKRNVHADVVALDQAMMINRLGTSRPGGMVYALRRDVESDDGGAELTAGHVRLRWGKRPRPMVLRVNVGDCLEIDFQNLLSKTTTDPNQPHTRAVSIHVAGLSPVSGITDDGNYAGQNPKSFADPGERMKYRLFAEREGSYLLYSSTGDYNGFSQMMLSMGLFGAVNVEPENAEAYRSQTTAEELRLARRCDGGPCKEDDYPVLDYGALYPADFDAKHPRSYRRSCLPVLKMIDVERRPETAGGKTTCKEVSSRLEILHTDLTALITGPGAGRFPEGQGGFPKNPALPDRRQPFREVTIHYHESQDVIQPFKDFYSAEIDKSTGLPLSYTLQTGQDGFAINYGVAGIGAEILANRFEVGASAKCVECKYEEFFLSSWALGDPAMLVDVPANSPATVTELESCQQDAKTCAKVPSPDRKAKATKAFYPDDPSNVYHSYLGDHVTFRILHAGAAVHHVHHHHAHQWLRTPDSDESHYLDSQAIGPGASFSLDLVYGGSGNRNKTPGDSIFHCHFYPHFAAGMWALFRVHDVLETGTGLDAGGAPAKGARALPDGEIAAGTPIPAIIPLPTLAMAPLPAKVSIQDGQVVNEGPGNPGFPFFVPGKAGHRAPHPPLDFAVDEKTKKPLDGGLPRHIVTGGKVSFEAHTPYDFTKDLGAIDATELDEAGTPVEREAMKAHATCKHATKRPDGSAGEFVMNGLPPAPGAPFADPAGEGDCRSVTGKKLVYKGANIQVNAVFSRKGWHFPQQRIMTLWEDVKDTLSGVKPPEPFFFRADSGQVIEYWHTNLVPAYYELDDFQVRTPTDILGQHIHLVKFDVTASDGAANGFNYEDGTFGPDEVRDRIEAINASKGIYDPTKKSRRTLKPQAIPALGDGPDGSWIGAQATIQRWYADPLLDNQGKDRTITTVFTHDHFGPSTHQQAGLYGALVIEPAGSTWTLPDGTPMGTRADGGPTSYAARILTKDESDSYRELLLAWQDLQLVYGNTSRSTPDSYKPGSITYRGWADPKNVINPPSCGSGCANAPAGQPQPQVISDFGAGMLSMSYRSEPLPLRIAKPGSGAAALSASAAADATDLSQAFRSIPRLDPAFNTQPKGGSLIDPGCKGASCFRYPVRPISSGMEGDDPYTPLFQAYENDKVQVRVVVGGHTSMHDFSIHGVRWLYEPGDADSGYRASQFAVISEHFEAAFRLPPATTDAARPFADYLYQASGSYEGLVNGLFGLVRAYDGRRGLRKDVKPLPNNPNGGVAAPPGPPPSLPAECDRGTPCLREVRVAAVSAGRVTGDSRYGLVYNGRGVNKGPGKGSFEDTPLYDPAAIVYVRVDDLDPTTGKLKPDVRLEPLVIRAAAGDWIKVTLENRLSPDDPVFSAKQDAGKPTVPYSNPYSGVSLTASSSVGLHPGLVSYDVASADGMNVGKNPVQTVPIAAGKYEDHLRARDFPSREYRWYAGLVTVNPDGTTKQTPAELGAVNLQPSDPLVHGYHGLTGALVIEPLGATWVEDPGSPTSATVMTKEGGVFRDFVVLTQDDVGLKLENLDFYTDGQNPISAMNYRTEPMFYRFGPRMPDVAKDWSKLTAADMQAIGNFDWSSIDTKLSMSNTLVGADPETPIFRAPAGMPVRFRLVYPTGTGDNQQTFELSGHAWQDEPYTEGSTKIGLHPGGTWTGTTTGVGPTSHYDVVVPAAGGAFHVPGDYVYRSWTAAQLQVGLWGLLRVAPRGSTPGFPDTVALRVAATSSGYSVSGYVTVDPRSRKLASQVRLQAGDTGADVPVSARGLFTFEGKGPLPKELTVTSPNGGTAVSRDDEAPAFTARATRRPVKGFKAAN